MKEATLIIKSKKYLREKGYTEFWKPPKNRWSKEEDVFGIIDILCLKKPGDLLGVQITTFQNRKARKKKIEKWIKKTGMDSPSFSLWVLSWHKKTKRIDPYWDIIRLA